MKKVKFWVKFPSWWLPKLKELQYKNDEYGTSNGKIAALMIYIAILIESSKNECFDQIKISYTDISTYLGISRSSIKKGVDVLKKEQDRVVAFNNFTLRTKTELHALKILLYIGSVRDNDKLSSIVSYDNLSENLGISRNDISKALSLLYINEFLVKASPIESRLVESENKYNLPNEYFLKGYTHFVKR